MDEAKGMILIVDDEESIRDILVRRLEADGYDCEVAADGKEALWKAFMKDFDLVLMDIKMPGLSGMEVLPKLIIDHPDTSVVMITAVLDTQTAVEAMKMGAYDYVNKPFDLDDLGMRIKRALERRRLILENKEYQFRLEQRVKQQVEQIQQYYQEAIQALSREQITLQELQAVRKTPHGQAISGEEAVASSREPSGSVKEFASKLSQVFSVATPDSLNERSEELQKQITLRQEEGDSLALYNGTVELAILPPVSLQQMLQLHEHLRPIPQIKVLNLGGSVDKGITIRLILETHTPLLKILRDLSEVEKASDEPEDAERKVPARRGEHPPVRRIVVGLSKMPPAKVSDTPPLESNSHTIASRPL